MASLDDYRKQELMKRSGIDTYAQGPFAAAAAKKSMPAAASQPGLIQRAFPNTMGAMSDRRTQIDAAQKTGGMGAALGQSARTVMNPLVGFAEDSANMVRGAIDPAAQALKTFATGDATPIGQEAQNPLVNAAMPKPATPAAPMSGAGAGRGAMNPPTNPVQQQGPTGAAATNPLVRQISPGIFRQGNSFSDTAAGAAEGARPAPISAQNMAAADALAARSQAQSNPLVQAAQPQGPQNLTPADTGQGTGYGLLNSNRIATRNALMDVQQMKPGSGKALSALLAQQADAPKMALERDQMAQRGQESAADRQMRGTELMARLGESSADRGLKARELADNSLVNAARREAMGVETGAAKQMADLRSAYLNADTPEKQAAAAAKLNALSGKVQQDEYMAVSGGETVVDNMGNTVKNPDVLVNKRTGQPVNGGQAKPAQTPLPAGMVRQVGTSGGRPVYEDASGKRFMGG